MAYLLLLAPSTQVKRLYSRSEKEEERLQDCSLLSVFEISFWPVIKMVKRWAAGEMALWSLDHPAPSYPPQQCMGRMQVDTGVHWPASQLAETARPTFRGKPCLKNMVEMYWGRLLVSASGLHRLTLQGHRSTHIPPRASTQIYPPMCHMSTFHNSLAFALCTRSCHCTHQLKVLPLHVLCCVDLTLGHWPLGYFPFGRCPATWIPNLMKIRATDPKGLRRKPQRFLFHLWHHLVWKQW